MKKIINTSKAPAAVGPYSQAVEIKRNTLSFQVRYQLILKQGNWLKEILLFRLNRYSGISAAILDSAGYSFSDVVKSTCLLSDMANFKAMNEVYGRYYSENQPARAAFAVKELPLGALIEIETIAMK